jgi:LysR family glycine cleavage system transcriptional activator
MKRKLPPLPTLRAFELVAHHLSFTRAAEELHVTQAAVSRQVKLLEEHLGRKLFVRLTRKIELTEEGQAYYHAIRAAFDRVEEATVIASRKRPRTTLTISVLPSIASLWLMPRLTSFWQANRDIDVQVISSIHPAGFASDDIDMAINIGKLPGKRYSKHAPRLDNVMVKEWRGIQADFLFPDVLTPVCSKQLLEQGHPLNHPKDLQHHRLIHTSVRRSAWQDWLACKGVRLDPFKHALEFGQYFMSLQAAREGEGIAIVPSILVDSFDQRAELVRPFPAILPSAGEYYLLTRSERYDKHAVKRFRNWILEQAATHHPGEQAVYSA